MALLITLIIAILGFACLAIAFVIGAKNSEDITENNLVESEIYPTFTIS